MYLLSVKVKASLGGSTTDWSESKGRFLSFFTCRFGIKWPDNHGLYGLRLHSVDSCSIYGKPPYRTSRKPSRSKALEIPGWSQESCRLLRIAPISFNPKGGILLCSLNCNRLLMRSVKGCFAYASQSLWTFLRKTLKKLHKLQAPWQPFSQRFVVIKPKRSDGEWKRGNIQDWR